MGCAPVAMVYSRTPEMDSNVQSMLEQSQIPIQVMVLDITEPWNYTATDVSQFFNNGTLERKQEIKAHRL